MLGFIDKRKRIFFLLLHTQDGGSYIMPEKHDRTAESQTGVLGQKKKKNFFSSSTYIGWGELHTQDGGSYIMPEKHDRPAESHAVVLSLPSLSM